MKLNKEQKTKLRIEYAIVFILLLLIEVLDVYKRQDTTIGKVKLFTLEESEPAVSDNYKTWNEMHAIIPTNKNNMAYDVWINVKKDTLINILKTFN